MDKRIRGRLWVIGALIVVSIISLVPRNTKQRVIDPSTGRLKDTTVRRLPINLGLDLQGGIHLALEVDRKSTRLNSSHSQISYAVFCLKKKKIIIRQDPLRQTHWHLT